MYFKGDSSPFRPTIRMNGDTNTVYSTVNCYAAAGTSGFNGSTTVSADKIELPLTPIASTDMYAEAYVGAYTSTTVCSPVLFQWGSCDSSTSQMPFCTGAGALRDGTAAITSITILCSNGNDAASGSTIQVFGYKDAA